MYYYFCAQYPAVIKIDGKHYGLLQDNAILINIANNPFVEICTLCEDGESLSFILDDKFLTNPRECVSVVDLSGGYYITFLKSYHSRKFTVIAQNRFNNCLVTVFNDNGYKISIETHTDLYIEHLYFDVNNLKIESFDNAIIIYFSNSKILCVFNILDRIEKIFERQVDEYKLSNTLKTTERLMDMKKHVVESEWKILQDKVELVDKKISESGYFSERLIVELMPYAFLEELLVGGDVKEYLDENLIKNAHRLSEYLGQYIGVSPPPEFKDENLVGIVKKDKKNKYHIEYVEFKFNNKKITNIKIV